MPKILCAEEQRHFHQYILTQRADNPSKVLVSSGNKVVMRRREPDEGFIRHAIQMPQEFLHNMVD
ncbi:MAG: hypothetical protein KF716_08305 [Anaerolineae bacterium]|nr:hypothetical protein [Anaerolineae bacterium]